MAVVEQLIQGKDGYTRAANIRYSGGNTNRPIAKLYSLELSANSDSNEVQHTTAKIATSDIVSQPSTDSVASTSPIRNSAIIAQQKIANWTRMLLSPAP